MECWWESSLFFCWLVWRFPMSPGTRRSTSRKCMQTSLGVYLNFWKLDVMFKQDFSFIVFSSKVRWITIQHLISRVKGKYFLFSRTLKTNQTWKRLTSVHLFSLLSQISESTIKTFFKPKHTSVLLFFHSILP